MAGSLTLNISYGIDAKPKDDPIIEIAEKAVESVTAIGNARALAFLSTFTIPTPHLFN